VSDEKLHFEDHLEMASWSTEMPQDDCVAYCSSLRTKGIHDWSSIAKTWTHRYVMCGCGLYERTGRGNSDHPGLTEYHFFQNCDVTRALAI
jgi:hypothetical protein